MHRLAPILSGVLILNACAPPTATLSDSHRAAMADSVSVAVAGFWDAWSAADVDRGMSFLADDATVATSGAAVLAGRSTIDDRWRPMFETVASQVIDFEISNVTVVSPDVVTVHQRGSFLVTDTAGEQGPSKVFAYTSVWIRRDGAWKLISGHRSDEAIS